MNLSEYEHKHYKNGRRVGSRASIGKHVLVAEKALGRPLPSGSCVHHMDGNKHNNNGDNLVICPDDAYHQLLHLRTRAYDACGNASWRKCKFCKQYDDPANMVMQQNYSKDGKTPYSGEFRHKACFAAYERNLRAKRGI